MAILNQPENIIPFPNLSVEQVATLQKPIIETPTTDELIRESKRLDRLSLYKSEYDWEIIRALEIRYKDRPIHSGIVKSNTIKLVNSHSTCQQCLYALEIDTYGRGCTHNCVYCYAKAELTVHGYWNNPIPVPVDLNEIRKIFYTAFETDKKSKWRELLLKRIPFRVGCMSDSFMWMDQKYKVSQEFLKIMKFYRYPYTVLTRSDLVATEEYIALLDKSLCSLQFSIPSTNDRMNKLIEPGTPSAKRRLAALKALNAAGFWTTVRINPLFPIYPDGYFTNPEFKWDGEIPKFDFTTFEMVDEIAATDTKSIIAGFGRFSSFALNNIQKATGFDLRKFYDRENVCKSARDWHYSDREIRHYYQEFKRRCDDKDIEMTTCYIGNGENHFWDHQDLWTNKKDCCNIKDRVSSFQTDAREIPFDSRLKFTTHKNSVAIDPATLHTPLGPMSNNSSWNPKPILSPEI
ncbi:MAG: hypothetical protein IPL83_09885 [Bdellovibrionales bacterium]|nr:hypothetical protein [Bdellovibrionales bacterium]